MARGAFWTIIVDDQPTAFRAPVREDLLPTLKQLQRQHPNAVIKWFQRGRLWETPGDAMDASKPPRRGPSWRPGGSHKDPREQYKVPRDVKRARWASQAAEGRGPWVKSGTQRNDERPARRNPEGSAGRPAGDERPARRSPESKAPRPAWKPKGEYGNTEGRPAWKPKGRGAGDRPAGDRPAWKPRAEGTGTRGNAEGRPAWKPKGDRAGKPWKADSRPPGGSKPRGEGGFKAEGRPAWKPKGPGGPGDRGPGSDRRAPRADRPGGDRPAWKPKDGPGRDRPREPRADWRGERSTRSDVTPRSAGGSPPPAKKGRTWRAGELPPADRKKKKPEE